MRNEKIDQGRRKFLKIGSIAGAGLVIGIQLPNCSANKVSASTKTISENELMPNAWIKIQHDDTVKVIVSHSEMGQGISTAISMIVCEELEADWSKVRFEMAPVADVYKHPKYGIQWTVSSMSIHSSWNRWREAGATARELLIVSAARFWNVSQSECYAEKSMVTHRPSGKSLRYGELIDKTDGISIPENIRLRN